MIELTEETFADTVTKGNGVSIVQFTAPWCGPCRMIAPVLTELETDGKIDYYKVNVDEQSELAINFQVMSIPTLLFFKDGEYKQTTIGMQRKAQIEDTIQSL